MKGGKEHLSRLHRREGNDRGGMKEIFLFGELKDVLPPHFRGVGFPSCVLWRHRQQIFCPVIYALTKVFFFPRFVLFLAWPYQIDSHVLE